MKVLVLSVAAWDDTNSLGNTLSNWFGDSPFEFRCIYGRDASPNTKCCSDFLSVSPLGIVKNILHPSRMARVVKVGPENRSANNQNFEENAIRGYSGVKRNLVRFGVEALYLSNIWLSQRVKTYITDYMPDVVFTFSIPDAFRYSLLKFIKEHTNAKIVQFIADDVYGAACSSDSLMNYIQRKRYPKFLKMADKIYGASLEMCSEYSRMFGVDIVPLYKGCAIEATKSTVQHPIKIVYAGNLLYGRLDTLALLAEAIQKVNKEESKILLEIYSGTAVEDSDLAKIDIPNSSRFCGKLPYEQIKKKLHEADIVLHVESFEQQQIEVVRYSFSTKIIDCLQSGAVMMVIGPQGISSVEYPRSIDGAIVIDKVETLERSLLELVENAFSLPKRAQLINSFAKKHHEMGVIRQRLNNDLLALLP